MSKVEMITASSAKALTDARNNAILNVLIEVERKADTLIREECELGNYYTTLRCSSEGLSDTVILHIEQYFMNRGYSVVTEKITRMGVDLLEIQLDWSK